MKITSKNSLVVIILLSVVSMASILFAVFTGLVLNSSLDEGIFKLNPVVIPKFQNSDTLIQVFPMKSAVITKSQMEDFTKKLIMEYITTRYTVTGSQFSMMQATGIGADANSMLNGAILKFPSYLPATNSFNIAYNSFVSGKNNDADEIKNLMAQRITRSVKIITEPYRYKDRWKTLVEFIYKMPDTNFIADAQRERWEINMEIDELRGRRIGDELPPMPSYVFGFNVKWIEKIRK